MRFFHNLALAALVAVVAAQGGPNTGNPNPFKIPNGGWQVSAGQPITLSWTPTTGGTVTLQLQWGGATALASGTTIISNLPNTGSYTWTPSSSLVAEPDFTVKIIDDQNPSEYNYSPRFVISGATGTATAAASTTASTGSSSAAVSTTSGSSSASASQTNSSSSTSSTSASSSSKVASTSSGSSTPSPTPTPTPATTTAPNNSGSANAPSALMGLLLGLVALL